MSITMRTIIFAAAARPSHVMCRSSHTSQIAVPLVKNRFITAVKITMMRIGLRPLVRDLNGTLETKMHSASTAAAKM